MQIGVDLYYCTFCGDSYYCSEFLFILKGKINIYIYIYIYQKKEKEKNIEKGYLYTYVLENLMCCSEITVHAPTLGYKKNKIYFKNGV